MKQKSEEAEIIEIYPFLSCETLGRRVLRAVTRGGRTVVRIISLWCDRNFNPASSILYHGFLIISSFSFSNAKRVE